MVQEVWHLHFPPWPVVVYIQTPVVEPTTNTFVGEDLLQSASAVQHQIFPCTLTNTNNNIAVIIRINIEMIVWQVWQEVVRRVVV